MEIHFEYAPLNIDEKDNFFFLEKEKIKITNGYRTIYWKLEKLSNIEIT